MTKAELVNEIAKKTSIEEAVVLQTVESLMKVIRESLVNGENVYLRGFGSFIVKKRAQKVGRNITKNTFVVIPEHFVPAFKPVKTFITKVKSNRKGVNQLSSIRELNNTAANPLSTIKNSVNRGAGKVVSIKRTPLAERSWDEIRGMGGKVSNG
jgi:DNA-binding protein HU-beta